VLQPVFLLLPATLLTVLPLDPLVSFLVSLSLPPISLAVSTLDLLASSLVLSLSLLVLFLVLNLLLPVSLAV
jgi:hypothetical protein